MVRICSVADMHGKLGFKIEPCDILCVCGDIVPVSFQTDNERSLKWIRKTFLSWCNEQPCNKVLLIGGNHDFVIYRQPEAIREIFKDTKVTYLLDEEFVYNGHDGTRIKFYGTPWCHKFYNWAFMDYDDKELKELFLKMPDDVDVLLSHDCPYGACDVLLQDVYWNTHEHIGSRGLADAIMERKPKLNLTGHLHSTNKDGEMLGDTFVCNTSVLDEGYDLMYSPHYFDFDGDGKFVRVDI